MCFCSSDGQRSRDRPVPVLDDRRDELGGPRALEQLRGRGRAVDGRLTLRRVVQHDGREAAHERHAVLGEQGLDLVGIGGQEAGRAELGRRHAHAGHLREHPRRGQHGAPAGHLADAPRDGCRLHAAEEVRHDSCLSLERSNNRGTLGARTQRTPGGGHADPRSRRRPHGGDPGGGPRRRPAGGRGARGQPHRGARRRARRPLRRPPRPLGRRAGPGAPTPPSWRCGTDAHGCPARRRSSGRAGRCCARSRSPSPSRAPSTPSTSPSGTAPPLQIGFQRRFDPRSARSTTGSATAGSASSTR